MLKQSINLVPSRPALYQAKLVFYLFIASLTMFFVGSLMTYCVVRTDAFRQEQFFYNSVTNSFESVQRQYETLQVPLSFWTSTGLLVLISIFLQWACWFVHREQQTGFRRCLVWAWAAAVTFVVVQSFGLVQLLTHHFSQTDGSTKIYGMTFTLAFIHALHVLGGIVFLGFVIFQSLRNRYDHERHWAVDHYAGYWHFLDIVWLSMLLVFAMTR